MKTLYIECGMGVAGDMLTAALTDLFPEKEKIVGELNDLNIPGVEYRLSDSVKCGITGRHMDVIVNGVCEDEHLHEHHHDHEHDHGHEQSHEHSHEHHHDHEHSHEHDHDHEHSHDGHTHTHTGMHQIEHIVWDLGLPAKVEQDVLAVYKLIAEAESKVHGVPVTDIHFHEVGTMDAVADIVAVCYLIHKLSVDDILASPVNTGSGTVKCAHGILPVPAPATAILLEGLPIYNDGIKGELTTPTGAALLKHFVRHFGNMPAMTTDAVGYGMGKKDFERANCVRVFLGDTIKKEKAAGGSLPKDKTPEDVVPELSCNVDDMTAEEIGFAMERLFEGGAYEVYTIPIGMKKNRPGTLLRVICPQERKEGLVRLLFAHTTTIGVRETVTYRNVLDRKIETFDTPYGPVRVKQVSGYGVERSKAEYEDLARIAKAEGISLREARERITEYLK